MFVLLGIIIGIVHYIKNRNRNKILPVVNPLQTNFGFKRKHKK